MAFTDEETRATQPTELAPEPSFGEAHEPSPGPARLPGMHRLPLRAGLSLRAQIPRPACFLLGHVISAPLALFLLFEMLCLYGFLGYSMN